MGAKPIPADKLPHQLFLRIAEIGWLNQDGKNRLSTSYSGKTVANVDRPLAVASYALRMILEHASWTTEEAMEQDIAEFRSRVDALLPARGGEPR